MKKYYLKSFTIVTDGKYYNIEYVMEKTYLIFLFQHIPCAIEYYGKIRLKNTVKIDNIPKYIIKDFKQEIEKQFLQGLIYEII